MDTITFRHSEAEETSSSRPANTDVCSQLDRLLNSATFRQRPKAAKILQFLVDETIQGHSVKEISIGTLFFDSNYDPQTSAGVRVAIHNLRRTLDEYYSTEGLNDEIKIALPSYTPVFTKCARATEAKSLELKDEDGEGALKDKLRSLDASTLVRLYDAVTDTLVERLESRLRAAEGSRVQNLRPNAVCSTKEEAVINSQSAGHLGNPCTTKTVRQILTQLDKKDRDLLTGLFLEERTKDELCLKFGVDHDYLRALIYRAKAQFQGKWEAAHNCEVWNSSANASLKR